MKLIGIMVLSLMCSSVYAHSNSVEDFLEASHEATKMTRTQYGDDSIVAYKVEDEGHEVEVSVLTDFVSETFTTIYGCHEHDDHFDCHVEAEMTAPSNENIARVNSSLLRRGERAAFNYVPDRLKDLLVSYVVFAVGQGHDQNVWVRFNFEIDGTAQTFFTGCHDLSHGDNDGHFHCHVYRNAPTEPVFE